MITDLVEFRDVQAHVAGLDDAELRQEMLESEARQREENARQAALLAEYDRRKTYKDDGHASMRGTLRSSLGWSEADCLKGMRVARLCDEFPDAGDSLLWHQASVANIAEVARARSNSRTGDQVGDVIGAFLRQAETQEHDVLCGRVRNWERARDRDREHATSQTAHENRTAQWHTDGTTAELAARFGPVDGLEVVEILAQYEEAEWRADWQWVLDTYGSDDASVALMPRSADQRRADAVVAALRDGASRPPGSKPPKPVVNIHLDWDSFQDIAVEAELLPERNVDPFEDPAPHVAELFSRTTNGTPVDQRTVLQVLLAGYVRWMIHNDEGEVIHCGRTKRLFEGAARDAVQSLFPRCTAPGCRVPTTRSEVDHRVEYSKGGATDPDNGGPGCKRHNLLRHNRQFTVTRDRLGNWHTYRPDGTEIQ